MTVSPVINGTGYTSAETPRPRWRRPSRSWATCPTPWPASCGRSAQRSPCVVSDISNPFFTTIARGVEDVAMAPGFWVIYCNTDESEAEEEQYLLMLVSARSTASSWYQPELRRVVPAPARHHVPVVVLDRTDRRRRRRQRAHVIPEAGAYALARHLLELGHRDIAHANGRDTISTSINRLAGCRHHG